MDVFSQDSAPLRIRSGCYRAETQVTDGCCGGLCPLRSPRAPPQFCGHLPPTAQAPSLSGEDCLKAAGATLL